MLDFNDYNVPDHTQTALTDYIERGIPVGGFLHAVLSNNLFDAVNKADSQNLPVLKDLTNWVSTQAPTGSWGAEALVLRWIQEHPAKKTRGPKDIV
jgi:hypothetical protein